MVEYVDMFSMLVCQYISTFNTRVRLVCDLWLTIWLSYPLSHSSTGFILLTSLSRSRLNSLVTNTTSISRSVTYNLLYLYKTLHKTLYKVSIVELLYTELLYTELLYVKLLNRASIYKVLYKALCRALYRASAEFRVEPPQSFVQSLCTQSFAQSLHEDFALDSILYKVEIYFSISLAC
jgi:hypothetical protein